MKGRYFIVCSLLLALALTACKDIKQQKTSLAIIDNNRHYYPIKQGEELKMTFEVKNVGKSPFILEDIITSCGCVIVKENAIASIPVDRVAKVQLSYDSTKNIGHVKHYVTIYGNLEHRTFVELVFDVNVVPDAHYTKDYEELYEEREAAKSKWERVVNSKPNGQIYYTDEVH